MKTVMVWLTAPNSWKETRQNRVMVTLCYKTVYAQPLIASTHAFKNCPKKLKKVLRTSALTVIDNETFHHLLTEGVDVKFSVGDGKSRTDKVWLVDFEHPESDKNEFLAVNQFTVVENNVNKRPDIVLFINGLPLVVIELKNAADEKADVQAAPTSYKLISR